MKKKVKRVFRGNRRNAVKKGAKHSKRVHAKMHFKKKHNLTHKRRISDERVSTGIKNFDKLIEGGFEKNSTNLLAGDLGSGKTIFATQFLVEGMNNGEKCLFVTFEEKREQFYFNMKKLGWDLAEYERKGLLTFLEYSPIKVKTMLEEGGGSIESIILKNKITRIVIDSITSFALLFKDELERREAALSLFSLIRGWNCTSLLTLEENSASMDSLSANSLEFESDSIIDLYFVREKAERKRFLEISKMRGTAHSRKTYPFEIGKKGVVLSKRPVSSFIGKR